MIFINPIGGLCNRMRSIESALQFSKQSREKLTVLWKLDKNLNCRFDKLFFPIDSVDFIYYSNFSLHKIKEIRDRCIVFENIKDVSNICLNFKKDIFISTPHQFFKVNNFADFIPLKSFIQASQKIVYKEMIGLHIRQTDNKKAIMNSPLSEFTKIIYHELDKNPNSLFFLSTDSKSVQKELINRFQKSIIIQKKKKWVRFLPGGIKCALIDLLCLNQCSKIYGSFWSSFSETASKWNKTICLEIVQKKL